MVAEATSKWHKFPGLPKWSPEIVPAGLLELWTAITPGCRVGLQRGLNQSCSPCRDLSNAMSHTQIGRREEVDSRLLVVGSQTSPSFTHNLGYKCPNCQCEGISISTFQDLSNDTRNTSMRGVLCLSVELWTFGSPKRFPTPNFSKCWASPPHLAKVGLRHERHMVFLVGFFDWSDHFDQVLSYTSNKKRQIS